MEVAVRGDSMDIGVFSMSHLYSESQAKAMVEDIAHRLGAIE